MAPRAGLLADLGRHRALSILDLIKSLRRNSPTLTVLSLDQDFEPIAKIPGQPVERLSIR